MFVHLCYPYESRLSTIPYCIVHEHKFTCRFRVALVQIPTKDLASYLDERHSPYVFLLEQEISKSYTRNIIPFAFKKKKKYHARNWRNEMFGIPSAAATAQLLQGLSYGLDFWGIAVRIPAVTIHLLLLRSIQNSSEAPLNFLLDTGGKLVGAYSWPLTPAQNQVNNGRIYNSTPPHAVMMSAGTLILNTPLPTMKLSPFFYCLIIRDVVHWIKQPIYTTHTRQTLFYFPKFSPTEYGGRVGPRAGLDVSEKRKLFYLPGNLTPDSQSIN